MSLAVAGAKRPVGHMKARIWSRTYFSRIMLLRQEEAPRGFRFLASACFLCEY